MKFYNERAVLLATLYFGSKVSGNADLGFVEVSKKLFCCIGKRRLDFFQIA
jgi:hypothetical protein